jgi:hypothetical protein
MQRRVGEYLIDSLNVLQVLFLYENVGIIELVRSRL